MAGIFNSSIFNNAIFNTDGEAIQDTILGGGAHYPDWRIEHKNDVYRAKEQEQQDEIIRLRLEAQDILLRQRELKDEKTKQAKRQMLALEREAAQLQIDIQEGIAKLLELQKQSVIYQNNLAFMVLTISNPFGGIRMQ